MAQIHTPRDWQHFHHTELVCKCTYENCPKHGMDEAFMTRLVHLRLEYNRPMILTSAYRCPRHNAKVSRTGTTGPHTKGVAVDVHVTDHDAGELVALALRHGFQRFGLRQHDDHTQRMVHLDGLKPATGSVLIWTYR